MNYTEKFNELKDTFGKSPDMSKITGNFAAQIVMTDDDCGGIFYIEYHGDTLNIEPYDYHDNTVNIITSSSTLEDILRGKKDPIAAFTAGDISLEGDPGHALMLIDALKLGEEKIAAPEKKTTRRKKTVKVNS